jgi:hypothetical protein
MKRLQLHLSTLLIVSLLAAGLVWLNVRIQQGPRFDGDFDGSGPLGYYPYYSVRGWPALYSHFYEDCFKVKSEFSVSAMGMDIGVAAALLAASTVAIEWATRRMKRKTNQ